MAAGAEIGRGGAVLKEEQPFDTILLEAGRDGKGLDMFSEEFEYFKENQEALVSQYCGKFLVLVGRKAVGAYPTALSAYMNAQKDHPLGTFMIQQCVPGPEAYTVTLATADVAVFDA